MPFLPLLETSFTRSAPKHAKTAADSSFLPLLERQGSREDITTTSSPTSPQHYRVAFDQTQNEIYEPTDQSSSAEQSPVRGRSSRRTTSTDRSASGFRSFHPLEHPETAQQGWEAFRQRLLSRDLTGEPAELVQELLEPRPRSSCQSCSISEELHRVASSEWSFDVSGFGGHRDTFALLRLAALLPRPSSKIYNLPTVFFVSLVGRLDLDEYKALRLVCRAWSIGATQARPVALPNVFKMPTEVLQQILSLLPASDFDAARHTCCAWMVASLDGSLLLRVIDELGFRRAAQYDSARYECREGRQLSVMSRNWLLSKRIATECSLSPAWTGRGLRAADDSRSRETSGMRLACEVDLAGLYTHHNCANAGQALQFAVSGCQSFLLVVAACNVFVYTLVTQGVGHVLGGSLRLVARLVCPKTIVTAKLIASNSGLILLMLLDDRTAIVHDVLLEDDPLQVQRRAEYLAWTAEDASKLGSCLGELPSSPASSWEQPGTSTRIYHDVCTSYDPPLSLAMSAQRHCVAFGNSNGIELHWIDSITGQHLRRWFPLSFPSDELHFVLAEDASDETSKLKILSSTFRRSQRRIKVGMSDERGRSRSSARDIHQTTSEFNLESVSIGVEDEVYMRPEHYGAVPLSDGVSVLFVDPLTLFLCLGHDAQSIRDGMRLTRRFAFHGPALGHVPFAFTAAQEMAWGVRIVAAYAKDHDDKASLWLFTIPPDIFWDDTDFEFAMPIDIVGVHIANIIGVSGLAIDASAGDLTVWALCTTSRAYVWQLASIQQDKIKKVVLDDGTVAVLADDDDDGDVDVTMADVEQTPTRQTEEDDGSASSEGGDLVLSDAEAVRIISEVPLGVALGRSLTGTVIYARDLLGQEGKEYVDRCAGVGSEPGSAGAADTGRVELEIFQ